MKPPKEAGTKGKVWHLEKCVYGLNDLTVKVGKEESKTFQYIGMELFSEGNTILLHQSKYGESLESIPLEKS